MKIIIRMPQDYMGEPLAHRIKDEQKQHAILNCDLVTIFDLLYRDSIKLIHKSPARFLIYTDDEWREEKGESVLMHGIAACFSIIYNYYVFNKQMMDMMMLEEHVSYSAKLWMQEMIEDEKKTYARVREKIIAFMETKTASSRT